jgi:hypothetical protein
LELWEFHYSRVRAIRACEPWVPGSKVEVWEHLPWCWIKFSRAALSPKHRALWSSECCSPILPDVPARDWVRWKSVEFDGRKQLELEDCIRCWVPFLHCCCLCHCCLKRWISCRRIVGSDGTSLWGGLYLDWSSADHGDCLLCLCSGSVLS